MPEPHLRADRIHEALARKMREAKGSHLTATLPAIECHPEDRALLLAFQHLKHGSPMNKPAWRILSRAAACGDLFIVTRESGDSEDRLARLQKRKTV